MKRSVLIPCAILVAGALLATGCSRGPSEEEQKLADLQTQMTTIEQAYAGLEQTRADLVAARSELAELEAIDPKRRDDDQKARVEALQQTVGQLDGERENSFEAVQSQLADFLNTALNNVPDAEVTRKALEIYAAESIIVAQDMVEKAGDYKKAINHLTTAEGYYAATSFPPYPPLIEMIDRFQEWRFINRERFDAVQKNMTVDEVRATAGVPYYGNIREDDQRGVEMWLYPKREGGAAGIYFKQKTGKVYDTKFDAITTKVVQD